MRICSAGGVSLCSGLRGTWYAVSCLSVCLSVSLSVSQSVCLLACLPACLSVGAFFLYATA